MPLCVCCATVVHVFSLDQVVGCIVLRLSARIQQVASVALCKLTMGAADLTVVAR